MYSTHVSQPQEIKFHPIISQSIIKILSRSCVAKQASSMPWWTLQTPSVLDDMMMMQPPQFKTLIPFQTSIWSSLLCSRHPRYPPRRTLSIKLSIALSPPLPTTSLIKITWSIALSNSPRFSSTPLNGVSESEPPFTIPILGPSLENSPSRFAYYTNVSLQIGTMTLKCN